jgi:hypothetical protein
MQIIFSLRHKVLFIFVPLFPKSYLSLHTSLFLLGCNSLHICVFTDLGVFQTKAVESDEGGTDDQSDIRRLGAL